MQLPSSLRGIQWMQMGRCFLGGGEVRGYFCPSTVIPMTIRCFFFQRATHKECTGAQDSQSTSEHFTFLEAGFPNWSNQQVSTSAARRWHRADRHLEGPGALLPRLQEGTVADTYPLQPEYGRWSKNSRISGETKR